MVNHDTHWVIAPSGHPHQMILTQFMYRRLTPYLTEQVSEHVTGCPDCREKIMKMAGQGKLRTA